MRPGGEAIRRRIESEVTLLPQPDSPTTASVSPGAHRERHAVDRAHDAVAREEMGLEVLDLEQRSGRGHASYMWRARRGSSASRMPSPSRLTDKHGQRQKDAGKEDQVAGDLEQRAALGHDVAPARDVGRRAGAEERQDRLGDHRRGTDVGALHQQRRDRVGQDVAQQDARRACAAAMAAST